MVHESEIELVSVCDQSVFCTFSLASDSPLASVLNIAATPAWEYTSYN